MIHIFYHLRAIFPHSFWEKMHGENMAGEGYPGLYQNLSSGLKKGHIVVHFKSINVPLFPNRLLARRTREKDRRSPPDLQKW